MTMLNISEYKIDNILKQTAIFRKYQHSVDSADNFETFISQTQEGSKKQQNQREGKKALRSSWTNICKLEVKRICY